MNRRLGAIATLVAAVAAVVGVFAGASNSATNHSTRAYCRKVQYVCNVALTATGPSPSSVTLPAADLGILGAYKYVQFHNTDSVTHTVVFANGLCSLTLAAGAYGNLPNIEGPPCNDNFPYYVGRYAYTVDGKFSGTVVTVPAHRSVTLTARTHTIRRGARLTLHGFVYPPGWRYHVSNPPSWKHIVTVTVLARHNSKQPYRPIATVNPRLLTANPGSWTLTVRPGEATTYIAKATGQPAQGKLWADAKSRPFRVRIRH